ncbi:MAG: diguanylate cyclase [Elusimicrobia bacterium]|nr:diguanylate cyclase [Elusimicrobiota bacterium]
MCLRTGIGTGRNASSNATIGRFIAHPQGVSQADFPALSISAWQVIQAMRDGVVLTDPRGSIMAVNDVFCAVTGYARDEVMGRNPRLLHSGRHDHAFYCRLWSDVLKTGVWQGEIWNRRKNGEIYPEWLTISSIKDAWGHTRCYLGVFRDITSPKLDEERLKHLAQYDALTSLPNRRTFTERLKRVLANRPAQHRLGILFLDLDHFKDINDRWSHSAGDAFLQAVGARLRSCVRRSDYTARWAGDEFAVLLHPVAGRRGAARVAAKILRALRRPFSVLGRRTKISASVGVCLYNGEGSAERLIDRADRAMYAVKEKGRNDVGFWSSAVSLRRRSATPQRGAAAKDVKKDRNTPQARTGMGSMRRRSGVRKGPSGS